MMSFFWWANVIGIIFSGTGAFILAYDVFSFRHKYPIGSIGYMLEEKPEHEKKNLNLIKAAMVLIPLGAALQLSALFLDS
jgi:hypothetical protein